MRQLSGVDSLFLYQETAAQPMHVGRLSIYDPSTAPDGVVRFKRIIKTMQDRAHLAPYLRERLTEIITETRNAKELTNAIGAKTMVEMANFMPTQLAALGARVATEQGLANVAQPVFNTVITNVPGSREPIYSNGAMLLNSFGLGLCADGNGLFHPVTSYTSHLTISITCCREMMPDPAFYAECLRESFAELKAAYTQEDPIEQSA